MCEIFAQDGFAVASVCEFVLHHWSAPAAEAVCVCVCYCVASLIRSSSCVRLVVLTQQVWDYSVLFFCHWTDVWGITRVSSMHSYALFMPLPWRSFTDPGSESHRSWYRVCLLYRTAVTSHRTQHRFNKTTPEKQRQQDQTIALHVVIRTETVWYLF